MSTDRASSYRSRRVARVAAGASTKGNSSAVRPSTSRTSSTGGAACRSASTLGHPGPGRERPVRVLVGGDLGPQPPLADAHGERQLAGAGVVGAVLDVRVRAERGQPGVPHPAYRHAPSMHG